MARRLVAAQHPDLAHLPVRRLGSGWDTVVHRLGPDLVVRLPRRALGVQALTRELAWLPRLPDLPLPIPAPVRAGEPDDRFPAPWAICRFVPGRPVGPGLPDGPVGQRAATQLAGLLRALRVPTPPGAPTNEFRGVPLRHRDEALRTRIVAVAQADRAALLRVWEVGLAAPDHAAPACWLHGDLHGLNVLTDRRGLGTERRGLGIERRGLGIERRGLGIDGRGISGVIDFGDLCAGDPAGDLTCAWLVLGPAARATLREELSVTDDAWARGRAWAAYLAVMFLAHSAQDEQNAAIGARGIAEVLAG